MNRHQIIAGLSHFRLNPAQFEDMKTYEIKIYIATNLTIIQRVWLYKLIKESTYTGNKCDQQVVRLGAELHSRTKKPEPYGSATCEAYNTSTAAKSSPKASTA